jgi:hypothetical protein
MLERARRTLLRSLLLAGLLACGDATLEPLPLDVTVEASRATAAPGQSIEFVVNAQGGDLLGLHMDYGDGSAEQFGTGGARTARVTFRHAYSAVGVYQARATVTDAVAGTKDASVEVRVQ